MRMRCMSMKCTWIYRPTNDNSVLNKKAHNTKSGCVCAFLKKAHFYFLLFRNSFSIKWRKYVVKKP